MLCSHRTIEGHRPFSAFPGKRFLTPLPICGRGPFLNGLFCISHPTLQENVAMFFRVHGFCLACDQSLFNGPVSSALLVLFLTVGFGLTQAQSQAIGLQGRIVQKDGRPIAEATVEWVRRGLSTKSGSDGSFNFSGSAVLHFSLLHFGKPRFANHPQFDSYNLLGATSSHRPHLLGFIHRVKASKHPQESKPTLALGKLSVNTMDTLRIHKSGFETRALPIENESAGNLGDILLTPVASGNDICAQQQSLRTTDGHDVILCEALYAQVPRIRLPTPALDRTYAVITADSFLTTDGHSYPRARDGGSDTEMRRHASALYTLHIQNGKVESFRPAILFEEALFLAPLIGQSFEGLISARNSNGRYELIPTLPIRLQITAETYTGPAKPASLYTVKAKITNFSQALTASDGTCMPALRSQGARMPFASDEGLTLLMGRVPSMHAFGDNELVIEILNGGTSLGSLMSIEWFFTPLDLIRNTLGLTGTYSGVGHGTPGSIPMMELKAALGGGKACETE
jgi:hypothetical protein